MENCNFQQFHYWLRPEDWRWVRWYRARPEALSMDDLFSLGGQSLWETDVERKDPRGIPLTPSRYVSPDPSVHSGQGRFGADESFTEGAEELPSGPPAFLTCGGEGWDSTVVYHPHVLTSIGPDGELNLRGGVVAGGQLHMVAPCWIPYGSCLHLRGGVVAGGRLAMRGNARLTLRGGVSVGGINELGSRGLHLRGGARAGGRLEMVGGATLTLRGGAVSGGRAATAGGSGLTLRGGAVAGGRLFPMGGSGLTLRGGAVAGGRLNMAGGADCGEVPVYVGGRARPHRLSGDEISFPAGTVGGDYVVVFTYEASSPPITTFPLGWSSLGSGDSPGGACSLSVHWKHWDGTGTAGVSVSGIIGVQFQLACVSVRGCGPPVLLGFDSGTSDAEFLATGDAGECPGVLVGAAAVPTYDAAFNTMTGMDDAAPVPTKTPMSVWKRRPAGPGVEGGYFVVPDDPGQWVTALVFFPPS